MGAMSRRTFISTAGASGAGMLAGTPIATAAAAAPPGRGEDRSTTHPATYPSIRQWHAHGGSWRLDASSRIVLDGSHRATGRSVAKMLAADLWTLARRRPGLAEGSPRAGDIVLRLDAGDHGLGSEGYTMRIGDTAEIAARSRSGLLYGTQSLLQVLAADPRRAEVPRGDARDYPTFPERGEMLDVGRKYYPLSYLREEIRRLAWMKLNTLHLHLTDWNGFRFESREHPGLASPQHYTQRELRELDAYAARWGVTIIPEIDLPGHAAWLCHYDARLRCRCASLDTTTGWNGGTTGGWVIDVTSGYARRFVKGLLAEVAGVFSGPYLHIGGDELPYDDAKRACPELVAYAKKHGMAYPGDVFVDFINDMNTTVRAHGKVTEIWQWWDYNGQRTSIHPDKNIRVDQWKGLPPERAAEGYQTIGTQDPQLYVSPGFGTHPGEYGFMESEKVYSSQPFPTGERIRGYKISRWSDKAETRPVEWLDEFARRPRQVIAERTWGGPRSARAVDFYERVDAIGEPPAARRGAPHLVALPWSRYRLLSVSSQETKAEHAAAEHAFDGDPQTCWSSKYTATAAFGPHHLAVDLGADYHLAAIRLAPRQDGKTVANLYDTPARTRDFRLEVSENGRRWRTVASGTLPDEQPAHTVGFRRTRARYVRFVALDDWAATFVVSLSELTVLHQPLPD